MSEHSAPLATKDAVLITQSGVSFPGSSPDQEVTWARAPGFDKEVPDTPEEKDDKDDKDDKADKADTKSSTESKSDMTKSSDGGAAGGEIRLAVSGTPFKPLDADEDYKNMQSMETMCMNCYAKGQEHFGTTKMLATRIPYFRDVILMSFECPHCNMRSSDLQPANEIAPKGCKYDLKVTITEGAENKEAFEDLKRQIIRSENATVYIPEVEFEISSQTKRGEINTVEGVLANAASSLEAGQEHRKADNADVAAKVQHVIDSLRLMATGKMSFRFILDDIAGNSFLENPYAPKPDHRVAITHYGRNKDQNEALGLDTDEAEAVPGTASATYHDKLVGFSVSQHVERKVQNLMDVAEKGAVLPGVCHECHAQSETRMCMTDIPFFKEIILMVSQCDNCGYKDSEVKPAGAISAKGLKVTLKLTTPDDLKRDILKSDTAGLTFPEIDLELTHGTLGGKYTTIEGMLADIRTQLASTNSFAMGDSSVSDRKDKMADFFERFDKMATVDKPFTLILDDPMGNVFIHNPFAPKADPNMTIEEYERTFEQNEELGLNDMKVEEADYRKGMDSSDDEGDAKPKKEGDAGTSAAVAVVHAATAAASSAAAPAAKEAPKATAAAASAFGGGAAAPAAAASAPKER